MDRTPTYEETEALDLRYYAQLAYRYLLVLILVPVILAAAAYFQADAQAREYSATSQVLLRPNDPNERLGSSSQTVSQISNIEQYVRSQGNLARSPEIRNAVAGTLEVDADDLKEAVNVTALVDSNTLEITATTRSAEWSAKLANAVAEEYIANRREYARAGLERAIDDIDGKLADVENQLASLTRQTESASVGAQIATATQQFEELTTRKYELEIDVSLKTGEAELIAEAEEPESPVSPRPLRSAILGGMLGALLAAGGVLLKDRFDTRLRSREEAEAVTGLTALGELPYDKSTDKEETGIAVVRTPDGALAEAVRSLRVSLRFLSLESPVQVLLVTSPTPGDGKSTTSTNLAGSYAKAGQRTLLVSGDLRRPQAEKLAGTTTGPGLVELLTELATRREQNALPSQITGADGANGENTAEGASGNGTGSAELVTAQVRVSRTRAGARSLERTRTAAPPLWIAEWCHAEVDNLWVLPAGQPVANPVEILGSVATRDFFQLARQQFDMIVVDSPPVIAVADPVVLSPYVDGALIVCSERKTTRTALARATEILATGHARILGLVINRVPTKRGYSGYYYYAPEDSKK